MAGGGWLNERIVTFTEVNFGGQGWDVDISPGPQGFLRYFLNLSEGGRVQFFHHHSFGWESPDH
jgi:hypothetical protein